MSTTTLDPTVASKLRHFGTRRVRLLVARGICAGIVTFLMCIALVALIDWYWVLTDQTRWCLSGAAYLITAGVVWATSVRRLLYAPAREELATHVEAAQPELRENLLSAVELATDNPAAVHDSPAFRGLLQSKVARQMAGVRVARLLPLRMLAKWLLAALAVVMTVAFLMSLPDPRFRFLAARAILPGANIERISRIKVEVLEPTPNSLMIAKDETVAVVVEVTGGSFGDVVLETTTESGATSQIMRGRTNAEFAANIHVTGDTVQYRILAGDAITKRYTITGKSRPKVVAFHKTFQYPNYAGLKATTITEDHGDLLVLEGTAAELQLELDQGVSAAELRLDVSGSDDVMTVPLKKLDSGWWSATLPIEDAGIYKVHLVSAETGFENVFSPRYEIRPLPDLIPRAGFVDQQETNLLLPPNDILALKGMAEDDLPLVKVEQEVSVNGQDWVALQVEFKSPSDQPKGVGTGFSAQEPGANALRLIDGTASNRLTAAWDWDLLGLKLQTGDQVMTRLVATDRKGNRGESVPLRIIVSAPDFDPERHALMQQKAALYDDFAMLKTVGEEHRDAAKEIIERLKKESEGKLDAVRSVEDRALDRTNLADLAAKMREATGDLFRKITAVTRNMPAGADAYDLDLAGQVIARLHHEHTHSVDSRLEVLQHADDEKQVRRDLDELRRTFDRIKDDTHSVAFHFQPLVSHNIMAAVALDFDAMLRHQQLVVDSPTQTWSRLLRQEMVLLNQLEVAENLMQQQQHRLPKHMQNYLKQYTDWSQQRRIQLEQATESEDKLPELQRLAASLHRELRDRQRLDVMDGGLAERQNQARRDFQHRAGTLSEPLSRIAEAVQEENRVTIDASKADDSTKAETLTEQAARFAAEVDVKYRKSLNQLRSRRALTQSRPDADQQFAADAGLTIRAATAALNQHRNVDPAEFTVRDAFREIAPAYRVLEAGHDMKNAQICLTNLINSERWYSQDLAGRMDHPRQWDVVNKGLEEAINALRRASVQQEIMTRFDQIRWSQPVQQAHRKITQRRWSRDDMIAAGRDLLEMQDALHAADQELQPVMAEARAVIAKYAPTIPEMAEQIAMQVRKLEEDTLNVAETDTEKTPELTDLEQQQERINKQLDDLFEALVEDANQQDLLDDDQRERVRDADDSIAMVQEPAKQMNRELDEAENSPTPEQQNKELAEAAEAQEKTAQALDKVAAHFDRLEKDMDVADSRAELRQFERDQGIARQMDQKFEPTEQLAEMAQQNPDDLLRQLEEELKNNPAMQEALSEISQNTVEEAKNALRDAAQREQEIQRSNERSDEDFQAKKKELANNLKELGRDASRLSRQLIAQANSAASQAKTPEAQKSFQKTQQKLNEAASAANSANEQELQQDLAKKLQQAQEAIKSATESLLVAKEQSAKAKPKDIHNEDAKQRANAKKNLENQRKRFIDQVKREADGETRRIQSQERQADQRVKNAQNAVKQIDRQLQQVKRNLQKKPDDQGRKNQVAQVQQRKKDTEAKLAAEKENQKQAKAKTQQARDERNELNKVPTPPLNDKNPAAQLAEDYAQQAEQAAQKLQQQAEELAKNVDFGEELTPTKNRLGYAANEQQKVQDDVKATAEDLARASRHERRLEKAIVSVALQQAADDVQNVAEDEAEHAKLQLQTAEAKAADPKAEELSGDAKPAIAANAAVAKSEAALTAQAEALEPQTSDASAEGSDGSDAASGESGQQQQQQFTSEEMAQGQQLAQALDELDRQAGAEGLDSGESSGTVPSLAKAAALQQAKQAAARAMAQQQAALSLSSIGTGGRKPEGIPAYEGATTEFAITPVNRTENTDWGNLREQAAEDLTKGRRETVSEEYRKSVETYFRVLAERARKK